MEIICIKTARQEFKKLVGDKVVILLYKKSLQAGE
jgi:hypothetical protein